MSLMKQNSVFTLLFQMELAFVKQGYLPASVFLLLSKYKICILIPSHNQNQFSDFVFLKWLYICNFSIMATKLGQGKPK